MTADNNAGSVCFRSYKELGMISFIYRCLENCFQIKIDVLEE